MAGCFMNETQIFKSIAMSGFDGKPFVKAIAMGRAPLTAVMKAKHYVELAKNDNLPKGFAELYGNRPEQFFVATTELAERFGADAKKIPWSAVGLYTYFHDRVGTGLQQLMAGSGSGSSTS